MSLELYGIYSRSEALQRLGAPTSPATEWDGQLVVLPEELALFTALGPAEPASHFRSPDEFQFRPERAYEVTVPANGWMPQVLASHRSDGRELHLLVRQGSEDRFQYLGTLGLGMYTLPTDYRHQRGEFSLTPRLPRDLWLRYGGFAGWNVTLNHETRQLDTGDEAALAAWMDSERDAETMHLSLTRYEGDCLTLLANETQCYLSYQNVWGGDELSRNPQYAEDTEEVDDFSCSCGSALELPLCYVLPRALGLQVVREFFRHGVQPNLIEWSES